MKVLIAVDDDAESRDALSFAARLLPDEHDVVVLNVARSTITPYGTIGGLGTTFAGDAALSAEADLRAQEIADQEAERIVERAAHEVHADEQRVEHGDVGPTICQVAEDEGAELVVLGTHDRSRWSRLWFGSVSDHVVRHAPCPVLVVRR
ncbi:MAG TPA: universal stress protein [Acidimicrobiales bacterium]|nr:universal stress protein [Acidimicrobiales bacterium]